MISRFHALGLVLLAAVSTALAAPRDQVDAFGRVVREAAGNRKTYGRAEATRSGGMPLASKQIASRSAPNPMPLAATQAIGSITFGETWRFNNWVYGMGLGGFWSVDVDSNGDSEIVYGQGNGMGGQWAIADYVAATHDYTVRFKSALMTVTALQVVEVGNQKTIWVAGNTDGIRVYNLLTQELIATLPVPANVTITALEVGDGNNDGVPDVVALAPDRMLFFDAATRQSEPTILAGAAYFALGNVDDDADREIVLSDGRVLRVNGPDMAVEWNRGTAFGSRMRLADIDGDGRDELIVAQDWVSIQAWNLEAKAVKWDHPTVANVSAVRAFDVTADGVPEVFYGDAQWGGVHALDGNTGVESWVANNPEYGVHDILVSDPDDDGTLELTWGAGSGSSGPDYLYVVSTATRAVEYQSFDISDSFAAADVGDVDNDGRAELVVASSGSNSGYDGGVLLVFDAITHAPEYRGSTAPVFGAGTVQALKIANVDSDPQPEIVMMIDRLYDARLLVIDGISHAVEHEWPLDPGPPLPALDVADLDGDGQLDVVTAAYGNSSSPGQYLYVVNPRTGAILWKSPSLGPNYYPKAVYATDVGAPGRDLVASAGKVVRVRWSDKQQTLSVGDTYFSVLPLDVIGTAALEIVAGRNDGGIDVLNGDTLAVLSSHSNACVSGGSIPGVTALRAYGPHSVAYVCNGAIKIYDLASSTVMASVDTGLAFAGVNGSLVPFTTQGKSAFLTGGEWPAVFTDLTHNSAPVLNPLSGSVHWRGSTVLTITGSDVNGDALRYQVSGLPSLGTALLTDTAAGTLHYTSAGTAKGSDSLKVRASDGYQYSTPLTVALTLTNTAPTTTTTTLDVHWRGATARLAGNDADGDPLHYSIGTQPTRGTLTVSNAATGDMTFVPSGSFVGADAFTFLVTDGADASAVRSVQLNLTNSVPTAPNLSFTTRVGTTTSGGVSGTDPDGDPLTYALVTPPSRGTMTLNTATGTFDYVPAEGTGSVMATVSARDGVSESTPVTITFNPAPTGGGSNGGGGGSLDLVLLALLGACLLLRSRCRRVP